MSVMRSSRLSHIPVRYEYPGLDREPERLAAVLPQLAFGIGALLCVIATTAHDVIAVAKGFGLGWLAQCPLPLAAWLSTSASLTAPAGVSCAGGDTSQPFGRWYASEY